MWAGLHFGGPFEPTCASPGLQALVLPPGRPQLPVPVGCASAELGADPPESAQELPGGRGRGGAVSCLARATLQAAAAGVSAHGGVWRGAGNTGCGANGPLLISRSLSACSFSAPGCRALAAALRNNHSLKSLDVGENEIGDAGVGALSKALAASACALTTLG